MAPIPIDPNDVFCDLAEEGAALGLLGLMTGLSEEHWCASWMLGMEYSLWPPAAGTRFGMGAITERQATLLQLLAEEAGGWWTYDNEKGPTFVRLDAWKEKYDSARSSAG